MPGQTIWMWALLGAADPTPPPPPASAEAPASEALKPELTAAGQDNPAGEVLIPSDWQRDDWTLVRPKVALLQINGYLRLHAETLRRMDLGSGLATEVDLAGSDAPPRYPRLQQAADYSSTRMRLRLQPRINIGERAQIESTWDLFDNLVLGSTPDSLYLRPAGRQPPDLLSLSQATPRRGVDSLADTLAVKRLWGRVTAFNEQLELKVGRMPDHFGLGMLYNDGDGLEANWGTVVDRLAVSFRAFEHVFTPMIDWVGRGPLRQPFGAGDPMPLNASARDDTMQYALRIVRQDHPDDVRDALLHGRPSLAYGTSHAIRRQAEAYATLSDPGNIAAGIPWTLPTPDADLSRERRDGLLYIGDIWGTWARGPWSVGAEVALQAGHFSDRLQDSDGDQRRTEVLKAGGVAEGRWRRRLDGHGLNLALLAGVASGDTHAGIGALDAADTQRGGGDRTLNNFAFHPDYHVDQLLFRRIIGQVTDAAYLRPEIGYRFDANLMGKVGAMYAQLMEGNSAPSARSESAHRPLGIELDGELRLGPERPGPEGAVLGSLIGGLLFPLKGLSGTTTGGTSDASRFAWTLQARMWLTF